jgi:hypothetical protein
MQVEIKLEEYSTGSTLKITKPQKNNIIIKYIKIKIYK